MTAKEMAKLVCDSLEEKKAIDIKIIDISKISVLADYFVIAGGTNKKQVQALADNVAERLGRAGAEAKSTEGYQNAGWILLDFGDVIVHVFNQEERLFYDLERIWTEGQFLEPADL